MDAGADLFNFRADRIVYCVGDCGQHSGEGGEPEAGAGAEVRIGSQE